MNIMIHRLFLFVNGLVVLLFALLPCGSRYIIYSAFIDFLVKL